MSVAAPGRISLRTLGVSNAERKGLIAAHAIGLSVFFYLVVDRLKFFAFDIPHTRLVDLPIRLVAVWFLLDRFGRTGRTRFGLWDATYLLFVAIYGLGVVYADLFMWRQTGFLNYVDWVQLVLSPFLFFVVVREASLRKGFRPDVMLLWVIGTLVFCALLGLGQALNLPGIRALSADLYRWDYFDQQMIGPSAPYQARGTTPHANSQALYMLLGFCATPALAHWPRYRKWIVPILAVFLVGAYATYSRMGMAATFATVFGVGVYLVIRRSYRTGFAVLGTLVFLAVCFVGLIYAMDVKRFKGPIEGHGVVKGATGNLESLEGRKSASLVALRIGSLYPLFGVNAVGGAINEIRVLSQNAYSFNAVLNSLVPYTFASYGLVGLLFLAGLYVSILRTPWLQSRLLFMDASLFMCGIALVAAGVTENVVFLPQPMVLLNVLVGLLYGYGWKRLAHSHAMDTSALQGWQPANSIRALSPR